MDDAERIEAVARAWFVGSDVLWDDATVDARDQAITEARRFIAMFDAAFGVPARG